MLGDGIECRAGGRPVERVRAGFGCAEAPVRFADIAWADALMGALILGQVLAGAWRRVAAMLDAWACLYWGQQ